VLNLNTESRARRLAVELQSRISISVLYGRQPSKVRVHYQLGSAPLPDHLIHDSLSHVYFRMIGRLLLPACPKWVHFRESPDLFGPSPLRICSIRRPPVAMGSNGGQQGFSSKAPRPLWTCSPTNIVELACTSYFEYAASMNKLPVGDPGVEGRFA
jgi:hypothetical protein